MLLGNVDLHMYAKFSKNRPCGSRVMSIFTNRPQTDGRTQIVIIVQTQGSWNFSLLVTECAPILEINVKLASSDDIIMQSYCNLRPRMEISILSCSYFASVRRS